MDSDHGEVRHDIKGLRVVPLRAAVVVDGMRGVLEGIIHVHLHKSIGLVSLSVGDDYLQVIWPCLRDLKVNQIETARVPVYFSKLLVMDGMSFLASMMSLPTRCKALRWPPIRMTLRTLQPSIYIKLGKATQGVVCLGFSEEVSASS